MRILVIFICLLIVSGCTSAPQQIRYYQLNAPIFEHNKSTSQFELIVTGVDVSGSLRSRGITMAVSDVETRNANFHLWNTTLSQQLATTSVLNLASKLPNATVFDAKYQTPHTASQPRYALQWQVLQFGGDSQGNAIVSGTWYLYKYSDQQLELVKSSQFKKVKALDESGYAGLVKTLNVLWQEQNSQLAEVILTH